MRRLAVLTFFAAMLVAMTASTAAAQSIGVRAGGQLSTLAGDGSEDFGMRPGFHVGAFTTLSAGPLSLRPEILYTVQGTTYEGPAEFESADALRLSYLQVPVFAKFDLMPGPIAPYIAAGPYAQLLLGASSITDGIDADVDVKEFYSTWTFGVSGAVGAALQTPVGGLSAELRYTRDLVDMDGDPGGAASQYNSVIALSVGLQF